MDIRIDDQWLLAHGACQDGSKWFHEHHPGGLQLNDEAIKPLAMAPADYTEWLVYMVHKDVAERTVADELDTFHAVLVNGLLGAFPDNVEGRYAREHICGWCCGYRHISSAASRLIYSGEVTRARTGLGGSVTAAVVVYVVDSALHQSYASRLSTLIGTVLREVAHHNQHSVTARCTAQQQVWAAFTDALLNVIERN